MSLGSVHFAGYVPLYRDVMAHTIDGRLTNNEALVLIYLAMLADKSTGEGTINGPSLRYFLPGLSKGAAQRALESLEAKRYIYRAVVPRSPLVYAYWVAGFHVTAGRYKACQLDLSEVFTTKDTSRLRYVEAVPDTKPDGKPAVRPEAEPESAKYNETREEKLRKEIPETSPLVNEKVAVELRTGADAKPIKGEPDAALTWKENAQSAASTPELRRDNYPTTALPPGFEWRGDALYTPQGTKVHPDVVPLVLRTQGNPNDSTR